MAKTNYNPAAGGVMPPTNEEFARLLMRFMFDGLMEDARKWHKKGRRGFVLVQAHKAQAAAFGDEWEQTDLGVLPVRYITAKSPEIQTYGWPNERLEKIVSIYDPKTQFCFVITHSDGSCTSGRTGIDLPIPPPEKPRRPTVHDAICGEKQKNERDGKGGRHGH